MTRADWTRIRALFHRAMERSTHERAAFLREQCDDEVIRQEVESLLAAHANANGFMDGSIVGVRRDLDGEIAPPGVAPGRRIVRQPDAAVLPQLYATDPAARRLLRQPQYTWKQRAIPLDAAEWSRPRTLSLLQQTVGQLAVPIDDLPVLR